MNEKEVRPQRRALKVSVWVALALVVAMVSAVGIYAYSLVSSYEGNVTAIEVPKDRGVTGYTPPPAVADGINVLLIGSDARGEVDDSLLTGEATGQRSDALMLAHLPSDRSGVQVMSIMRDSWVDIPGRGMGKINWAMSYGGIPLTIATVEQLTGVPIDHAAIVGFDSFAGITDALGGVAVNNSIAFESRGSSFASGTIKLNGEDALKYVRERYSFSDGDYQRVRNQQAFMSGILDKVLSTETLSSPLTISALVDKLSPYLTVDSGLTVPRIAEIALSMGSVRKANVSFFALPTAGTGMIGDQSVVLVDEAGLEEVRQAFASDTVAALAAELTAQGAAS